MTFTQIDIEEFEFMICKGTATFFTRVARYDAYNIVSVRIVLTLQPEATLEWFIGRKLIRSISVQA